ncbi:MAG: carboxylate--amine ligase [Deltaproteobacteria bacterium]|nr:carboxylate--amine ligase [Deltaproteobacteria bacterium]
MKRILITGAGGAPAANFIRSLRKSGEPFYLIGADCDKFYLQRAETDEKYLVPTANRPEYLPVLTDLIKETGAELLFAQPDVEIEVLSRVRESLPIRTFWPAQETIETCMNKYSSFLKWEEAGIKVPRTMLIKKEGDLRVAFARLGPRLWLREYKGAFGKGSLPTDDLDQAIAWINFRKGWGNYLAAECLTEASVTWQSIWDSGELVVAQGRRRLYWEFANRAPSGVTGLTGTGVTVSDPLIDALALKAIKAVDKRPHGIFSVDFTYDSANMPNPTEINIGRFFTTHQFFTEAGLNMPYIYVKLAFGEEPPLPSKRVNPLTPGLAWVRGMDIEPVLTTMSEIEMHAKRLNERLEKLKCVTA